MQPADNDYILTAEEMAKVDRFAIEELGIPGRVLMEQAGAAVAEVCLGLLPGGKAARAVVVCGRGNNGGDGFVVARRLQERGCEVEVILLADPEQVRGDARANLDLWRRLGNEIAPVGKELEERLLRADLIVDAMLGTGARGALREPYREICRLINRSKAAVVAVDLPTGVDADTGECDPDAVRADATVTFGARKPGLIFSPGFEHAGRLWVADIGFPAAACQHVAPQTHLLTEKHAAAMLPDRPRTLFKNRCGQVYLVAGRVGMGGAAYLAARATIRCGAGLVILGCPKSLALQFEGKLIEVIKEPLAEKNGGLSDGAWATIAARFDWADAMAVGPGLGVSPAVKQIVERIVVEYEGRLIVDADGINALKQNSELLRRRKGETILTPHPGEFSRLTGRAKEAVLREPVRVAREFATEFGVHLLLKGAPSVAALPDGKVYVNSAGNPGMASAGMGDVLTGALAGFAGRLPARDALLLGMYVHSRAGDEAAASLGQTALNAGDVLEALPKVLQRLEGMRPA